MLRVAIYLANGDEETIEGLEAFDIDIVRGPVPTGKSRRRKIERSPDAVLVAQGILSSSAFPRRSRHWNNRSVSVVVLADESTDGPTSHLPGDCRFPILLQLGVDAIVPRGCGPAAVAAALWSAHHQKGRTRTLIAELDTLRAKVEQRKTIDRAKSIIAEQLGISEAEALRRLRHQARNQRRSMHELSTALIEAHQLLSPPATVSLTSPARLFSSASP